MNAGRPSPRNRKQPTETTTNTTAAAGSIVPVTVRRYSRGAKTTACSDYVVTEEPLEIRVRGRGIAITMRTPGHDHELAAGFLLGEGIVRHRSDVVEIAACLKSESPENTLNVFLAPRVKLDFQLFTRHVFASSSCGVCGKASIEAIRQQFPPVESAQQVSPGTLLQLPDRMRSAQAAFNQTGGLHAAGLFDASGNLLALREDVGRHNAVDKVIGHGFLQGALPYDSHVLLVSGRASFEILQKALAARIPIICAVGAPSSLAVEFAVESGQTLVGFLRPDSMNIYCGAKRIVAA